MDARLPDSRFTLDLLIAEARRRTRLRRALVVLAAVVAAGAVMTIQPWGGGRAPRAAAGTTAIARIPGMTRVLVTGAGSSVCSGLKGAWPKLPPFCAALQLRGGRYEAWILTSAYEQGRRLNVSGRFAEAHPGPVIVTDQWMRLGSSRQAERYVRGPSFVPSGPRVTPVNGGVARLIGTTGSGFYFAGQRSPAREFEFFWTSGSTVVNVNVIGAELTVSQARQIALLARPR